MKIKIISDKAITIIIITILIVSNVISLFSVYRYNQINVLYLDSFKELAEEYKSLADNYKECTGSRTTIDNENSLNKKKAIEKEKSLQLLSDKYNELLIRVDSCKLCDLDLTRTDFGTGGIYYTDSFYCVWTRGLNYSSIQYADYHEVAHDLVYKDYAHFCD